MNNLDFFDRPIAFHRCFVTITGSITAALMLSQAVYWSKRTKDKENWFYKIQSEWEEETGLTRREQDTARRCLRELGIFEEKRAGVPAKIYFKVNAERVLELLEISNKTGSKPQDIQIGGNVQSRLAETYNLDWRKAPNLIGGNVQSITENITENTSEITTKKEGAIAPAVEKKRFEIPTVNEVANQISILGYSVDAEAFHAFYSSNGWMVGKSKMKCWKSALVTWQKRGNAGNYQQAKKFNFNDAVDKVFDEMETMIFN